MKDEGRRSKGEGQSTYSFLIRDDLGLEQVCGHRKRAALVIQVNQLSGVLSDSLGKNLVLLSKGNLENSENLKIFSHLLWAKKMGILRKNKQTSRGRQVG